MVPNKKEDSQIWRESMEDLPDANKLTSEARKGTVGSGVKPPFISQVGKFTENRAPTRSHYSLKMDHLEPT